MRRYVREHNRAIRIVGACAIVLVNVVRLQELHLALVALHIGKIVTALALLLLFANPAQKNVKPIMEFTQTRLYLGIFALAVLSVPGGVWPGQSFGTVVNVLPKMALFYYCLIRFVHTEEDLLTVMKTLVLGLTFVAFLSLFSSATRFSAGYTYDANDIGMLICAAFPLAYFLRMTTPKVYKKLVWIGCCGLLFIGLIATQSRGGFLGMCFIVPYCLFRDKMVGKVKAVVLLVSAVGFFALFAPESYVDRISTILSPEEDYNYTHQAGRVEIWKNGLSIILENPILGVGITGFVAAEGQEHEKGAWKAAHNFLIQIAAELGLGGLVLMLSLLYVCIRDIRRLRNRPNDLSQMMKDLTVGLEGAFYGFIITALFLSQAYSSTLLYLAGNVVILSRIGVKPKTRAKRK